jgi:hypothetical protein
MYVHVYVLHHTVPEALPLQHIARVLGYHTVALPFTFKSILRQNKNYGNSNNNFTMQKQQNLAKNPLKETQKSFKILL